MLGFGGEIWGQGFNLTSHCFAINGNIFWPEVQGVEGMVASYLNALSKVKLSGPTYFAPLLEYVNTAVTYFTEEFPSKYFVLLLMTDGEIHDMDQTIDQIVVSSYLPLSIIIVGIGNANFSSMDQLDADDGPLFSSKFQKF